jgi:hypothetical protein
MKTFRLLHSLSLRRRWRIAFLIVSSACMASLLKAQAPPAAPPAASQEIAPQRLSPEELDKLLAPIALYPDALIALILPASTVPSDVVLAARFVASNSDPSQIVNQPWDDSVKSLARYPDVLKWMDQNLDWTTAVGDVFIDQPADVMNSVQRLRTEALAAGNLFDTPQQTIIKEETSIRIVPTETEVIYVPEYDPEVVYVQPYSQDFGSALTFGVGFAVGSWLNYDCDWDRRGIYVGHWRPGWKRDRDWDRGDWDRGDRGPDNNIVNVVNINSDTARQWQPSASSQRQQRVRRSNTRFSNVETSNVNPARGGPSATGLPEAADSRINQIPKPSRLGIAGQGRERDRRNGKADRDSRSNELPAASIPATDAVQGNNQKVSEPGADPNIAGEQGTPRTGGGKGKDSRNLSKEDGGNPQGPNTGSANPVSEGRGKDRKVPETTVAPSVAGEQGTPPAIGDQKNTARDLNRQGRGNRQDPAQNNIGVTNRSGEGRDKDGKAPQPTAPPNVAGEQGTLPAVGQQGSAPRNVNKQGRDNRQGTGAGGQNATSEARGKNRKAPQPTAPPNVAGEQGTPPATGDQQSAVRNVNKQEKSSRPKSAAVDASRDRRRQSSNDGQGGGPRDSKKNAQSGASSQPPAANTGAPKQKQQKQVNHAQSAPPQPGTSQQRSNERKREQKPPSQPAAAKQNKPPPQQPTAAKQSQQPQRSAAPQQNAPSKPPNAPQGKGKGKGGGEGGEKKDKRDKRADHSFNAASISKARPRWFD